MAKHRFKKGEPKPAGSGMQKGQKTAKVQQWEKLGEYITGELTEKVLAYINTLPPEKQFQAYMDLLEYFKPKLQRSEIKADPDTVLNPIINIQVDGKEMNLSRDV